MAGLPPLPTYPTSAETYGSLKQFVANLGALITNFNPGGVADTILKAIGVALGSDASTLPNVTQAGGFERLSAAQKAAYMSTAGGTDLDRKCADVNVFRKQPTAATCIVTVTLSTTQTLPAGTVILAVPSDPTQAQVPYTTNVATACTATVPILVAVTCSVVGSIGNQPIDALSVIQFSGGTVTNTVAADGGNDQEQDDIPNGGLRARGLAAIPSIDCTNAGIIEAAEAYDGIVSATVVDLTDVDGITPIIGKGQLYVADSSGDIGNPLNPLNSLIAQIQSDFNKGLNRAVGSIIGVHGSRLAETTCALTIFASQAWLNAGGTYALLTANVEAAIAAVVASVPISKTVYLSAVVAAVQGVTGVVFVVDASVLLNGNNANFVPPVGYKPQVENPTTGDIVVTIAGNV